MGAATNKRTDALVSLQAASAGTTGTDTQVNNHRGIILHINISAISGTGASLTVTLKGKDHLSGQYYTVLASSALTTTGLTVLRVYPGLTASANVTANDVLPGIYRIDTTIAGTTPSVTATVSAVLID